VATPRVVVSTRVRAIRRAAAVLAQARWRHAGMDAQFVPALHMRLEPWYLIGMAVWASRSSRSGS
jgi:hypothetical protein